MTSSCPTLTVLFWLLGAAPDSAALAKVREAYQGLDYQIAARLAQELVQRPDASTDERAEAYALWGMALAVREVVDAEPPFRALLRLKPDYELPDGTEPKILAAFRKVQVEEKALARQLAASRRAQLRSGLSLSGELPAKGRGGEPLAFSFKLKDPTGAVDAVRVAFRRQGEGSYSSLALARTDDGHWSGAVPGETTANDGGSVLEYYLEASDEQGPLLTRGQQGEPLAVALTPGRPRARVPRNVFIGALAATGVSGAVLAGLGGAFLKAGQDYDAYKLGPGTISAETLSRLGRQAQTLGQATGVAMGITAGLAVLAAVLALWVDF